MSITVQGQLVHRLHAMDETSDAKQIFFQLWQDPLLNHDWLTSFDVRLVMQPRIDVDFELIVVPTDIGMHYKCPPEVNIITQRRSIAKSIGCLQQRLFVNTKTSVRVNIGWWNLGVGTLYKNLSQVRMLGIIAPWVRTPQKCGIRLWRWENQYRLSSSTADIINIFGSSPCNKDYGGKQCEYGPDSSPTSPSFFRHSACFFFTSAPSCLQWQTKHMRFTATPL